MLRFISLPILSLLFFNNLHAQEIPLADYKPNIIIHRENQFSLKSLPRNVKWQGLYCQDQHCEIKNVKVKIGKKFVDYLDEEKVPLDTIKVNGNPIAIFPNEKFKKGNVTSFYILDTKDNYDFPHTSNKQYNNLENDKEWLIPWGKQPLKLFWTQINDEQNKDRIDYRNYQITDGKITQSLFKIDGQSKYEGNTTPIVYWVGDFDRDNKLDMILEIPDDNCGFDYRLYLSSATSKGEILHQSLRFTGYQEACGC